jgi:hypothetical protein
VFGVLSVVLYKPWRRQVDRQREHLVPNEALEERVEDVPNLEGNSAGRAIDLVEESPYIQRVEEDARGKC